MALGIGGMAGESGNNDGEKKTKNPNAAPIRKLTESHLNQITVLRAMANANAGDENSAAVSHLQIEEVVEVTGLEDEKEIQRILFILEGQKLVAPYPEGDFTSRIWRITAEGKKALKSIEKAFAGE